MEHFIGKEGFNLRKKCLNLSPLKNLFSFLESLQCTNLFQILTQKSQIFLILRAGDPLWIKSALKHHKN